MFGFGHKADLLVIIAGLAPVAVLLHLNRLVVDLEIVPVLWILVQLPFDFFEQFEEIHLVGVFHEDIAEALNEPSPVFGSGKILAIC
jgi:hypothetical protein